MNAYAARLWQTEDLPLFAGSAPTIHTEPFTPAQATTQGHIGTCPICYDTGTITIRGKTRRCICQTKREEPQP